MVALAAHSQIFEDEERLPASLAAAKRSGHPRARRSERREAVGFGREVVELRAIVDFREVPAAAALEREAAVDAASRSGRRPLDAKRAHDAGDRGLQRGEKIGGDQGRRSVARARLIAARTCEGAVPPTWARLAIDPSSVSTR